MCVCIINRFQIGTSMFVSNSHLGVYVVSVTSNFGVQLSLFYTDVYTLKAVSHMGAGIFISFNIFSHMLFALHL